jgi:hypothetical protein
VRKWEEMEAAADEFGVRLPAFRGGAKAVGSRSIYMKHFGTLAGCQVSGSMMRALTEVESEAELFALVIALGRERGVELAVAQLAEIARANRRAWLERRLV